MRGNPDLKIAKTPLHNSSFIIPPPFSPSPLSPIPYPLSPIPYPLSCLLSLTGYSIHHWTDIAALKIAGVACPVEIRHADVEYSQLQHRVIPQN